MRTILGGGQIERRKIEVARAFLDLLSAKDMTGCSALWRADAGQDMPFSPPGFPVQVEGKSVETLEGLSGRARCIPCRKPFLLNRLHNVATAPLG